MRVCLSDAWLLTVVVVGVEIEGVNSSLHQTCTRVL